MIHLLADIFPKVEIGALGSGLFAIIVGFTILALVLTVVSLGAGLWTRFFSRKPPFDDELAKHNATIEKIKNELAGLAPNDKVDALIEKLGSFATLNQLAEVKLESDREIKELRAYSHKGVHDARNDLGARITSLEAGVIERGERLAAVETDVTSIKRTVGAFDQKLDRLIEATGELRGRNQRKD